MIQDFGFFTANNKFNYDYFIKEILKGRPNSDDVGNTPDSTRTSIVCPVVTHP